MRKTLLTILGLLAIGQFDVTSQAKEIRLGDTVVIIERLTLTEADDRTIERIRSAQANNEVSSDRRVDDFRTKGGRLEKDYERIINGFNKKGIKYKESNRKEFDEYLTSDNAKVVYLTNDYTGREEKHLLIITMTFKLLSAEKRTLLNEPAKGILKQVSRT